MPTAIEGLWALPVQQLAAGERHSAALTNSGFLFTWGSNKNGQLGLPAGAEVAAQTQVRIKVHVEQAHALLLEA